MTALPQKKSGRFTGNGEFFQHTAARPIGILLSNLGTPDAPTTTAVRRYLKQFLWDPRVIELSRPLWWLLLNSVILPFRPKKSAALYQTVWTKEGSPLLLNSVEQTEKFEAELKRVSSQPVAVALGMRYGNPSIPAALEKLRLQGCDKLIVVPLFPQYSATTSASIFDAVADVLKTWRWVPELRVVMRYHDHPKYIAALAAQISGFWEKNGKPEKLIFSFHGIPKSYFLAGDPYQCYCQKTARLVAEALSLEKESYQVCFQSLFGRAEWLRPYTAEVLEQLGRAKLRSLDVICPGFVADCLETLEEIEEQNKEVFLHAGGGQYRYIPALNSNSDFIEMLVDLVRTHGGEWFQENPESARAEREHSDKLFRVMNGE